MKKSIYKITLGAILASISVILKLTFDMALNIPTFGFPFYGIPLLLAGIILGPFYGLVVAIVADTAFGLVMGYMPLFVFSSIAWGVIPSLFKVKKHLSVWVFIVLLTYVVSSLMNSFAIYVYWGAKAMMGTLYIRLALIPLFTPVIAFVSKVIYERSIEHLMFIRSEII